MRYSQASVASEPAGLSASCPPVPLRRTSQRGNTPALFAQNLRQILQNPHPEKASPHPRDWSILLYSKQAPLPAFHSTAPPTPGSISRTRRDGGRGGGRSGGGQCGNFCGERWGAMATKANRLNLSFGVSPWPFACVCVCVLLFFWGGGGEFVMAPRRSVRQES